MALGCAAFTRQYSSGAVFVNEVTMAAPDIIRLDVRDPPVKPGYLYGPVTPDAGTGTIAVTGMADNGSGKIRVTVASGAPATDVVVSIYGVVGTTEANLGNWFCTNINSTTFDLQNSVFTNAYVSGGRIVPTSTWYQRTDPLTGALRYCHIVGPLCNYYRFADNQTTVYLNRAAADAVGNYSIAGGPAVTAVYRKSLPYDQGLAFDSVNGQCGTLSMKHFIFLKLASALVSGVTYIISNSASAFPATTLVFNDKVTRCSSIKASGLGHRPSDVGKWAALSEWIPGYATEGAVNFLVDYPSITAFNIIDSAGSVVSGPTAITQRIGPTDVETGSPIRPEYASSTNPPKVITAMTAGNPTTVVSTAHGWSNGQRIIFRGIGAPNSSWSNAFESTHATVTVVDANTFTVPINSTGFTGSATGNYVQPANSLAYPVYTANRCATYVFNLDFGAWTTGSGTYRIQIPGLGVSDPIPINDNVWLNAAQAHVAGYYTQCLGMPLDNRFNWARPVCYRDGQNGVSIYWSLLPGPLSAEYGGLAGIGVNVANCGIPPWKTSTQATGIFGGFMDAGDWDSMLYEHAPCIYDLIDLCYEKLPTAAKATSFNFPKSSQTIGATYAGTDALPDAVQQAIWFADFYRRTQAGGGNVASALMYSSNGGSNGVGGSLFEPSYISRMQAFLGASDHASNYAFAAVAAKLAFTFSAAGFSTLATLWQTSAVNAWNWAEALFGAAALVNTHSNTTVDNIFGLDTSIFNSGTWTVTGAGIPAGTTVTGVNSSTSITISAACTLTRTGSIFKFQQISVRDAYYNGVLNLTSNLGSSVTYETGMAGLQNLCCDSNGGGSRAMAAGCLFRLTGTTAYGNAVDLGYQGDVGAVFFGIGVWEYCHTAGLTPTQQNHADNYLNNVWPNYATNNFVAYQTGTSPYKNEGGTSNAFNPGSPNPGVIRAYIAKVAQSGTGNATAISFLKVIQNGEGYGFGANQLGMSATVGAGARWTKCGVLHRDREAAGVVAKYGYTPYFGSAAQGGGTSVFNLSSGAAPINWTVNNVDAAWQTVDFGQNRVVDPYYLMIPFFEFYIENTFMIDICEFTVEQSMVPRQAPAMWCNGWDK